MSGWIHTGRSTASQYILRRLSTRTHIHVCRLHCVVVVVVVGRVIRLLTYVSTAAYLMLDVGAWGAKWEDSLGLFIPNDIVEKPLTRGKAETSKAK